jgi:hypothetical protein
MLNTTRSRVRALAVAGMATVIGGIGAVALQANAAEVPAAAPAAAADLAAGGRPVPIPTIDPMIKPPPGSRPIGAYVVTAGTQNYPCDTTTGKFSTTSTPEAQLLGTGGRIHHFGLDGKPHWQSLRDTSEVIGKKAFGVDRAGTIQELLLQVTDHLGGTGVLTKADYINRLYTSGGVVPTGTCAAGQVASVPYKAVYVFWDAPTPPAA